MMKNIVVEKYSLTLRVMHLFGGLLLFGLLIIGFYMVGIDDEQRLIAFYETHKSLGILLLGLVIIRLCWRIWHGIPTRVKTHTRWEKALSRSIHWLLYILMFAMPISGWIMSNSAGFSVPFFGLFDVPSLVDKNDILLSIAQFAHKYIALGVLAAVGLHIIGALKHHFADHDETLKRMTYPGLGFRGGVFIAILASVLWITPLLLWSLGSVTQGDTHAAAHNAAHVSVHESTNINQGH